MPCGPVRTPARATTNSWLFPPATQEAQFDEKWSFVAKKQKRCDPHASRDATKGDCWDHVALDPEHRLVLSVVVGKRAEDNARQLVYEFRERSDGRFLNLITSPARRAAARTRGQNPGTIRCQTFQHRGRRQRPVRG